MAGYTGEFFGLAAALSWAVGSLFFSRVRVSATAMNLFKNSLGSLLLILTLLGLALFDGKPPLRFSLEIWGYLAASSIVGLVIGDTCYFRSLQILGPRRALVMTTLAPPAAVLCGWFVLAETQSPFAVLGILVTLVGVVWVILERGVSAESAGHFPGTTFAGVAYGSLGSLCQAVGAVLAKKGIDALDKLDAPRAAMEASFIRLVVAMLIGLAMGAAASKLRKWIRQVREPGALGRLLPGSFCGTYLGIWFSLLAFQYTSVGVATTLTSTSPIFVIPLVVLFLKQRMSSRAILGVGVALVGVVLLFVGR